MNPASGTGRTVVRITPCIGPCMGLSCCNCCGKAPAMHRTGNHIPFRMYDKECCKRTRVGKPESCMQLQGKTRAEWLNEPPEEGEDDGKTDR